MDLRKYWQKTWQKWRSKSSDKPSSEPFEKPQTATNKSLDSLREMLKDEHIPASVRSQLSNEYEQVQLLVDKLENQHVHIVVFGKVSCGKSSLLNAIIGQQAFSTSPLHGETKTKQSVNWNRYNDQNMILIDTPGTDEVQGKEREQLAQETASIADIILFVVDGDLTQSQLKQLQGIKQPNSQIILVLNKADLYTEDELSDLLKSLTEKTKDIIHPKYIVTTIAQAVSQTLIVEDAKGNQTRKQIKKQSDVKQLKQVIWDILEENGKTLTALNASLFAGEVSDKIAKKITQLKAQTAEKVVTTYCIAKGVGVAFNPVPVADLLIAAGLDVAMIRKLSKVYGLPVVGKEATKLTITIMAQLAALMGAVWGVNLLSSLLKTMSVGLSTTVTAGAQGALAYYATYMVGKVAEQYFIRGKSWGEKGPKKVAKEIVNNLDKDTILAQAREQILKKIKK